MALPLPCGFRLLHGRELDGYGWDELAELAVRIAAADSDEKELAIARGAGLVSADAQPVCWWERAPSADGSEGEASTAFNRVMTDGDAFNGVTPGNAHAEDTYVFPGFCF